MSEELDNIKKTKPKLLLIARTVFAATISSIIAAIMVFIIIFLIYHYNIINFGVVKLDPEIDLSLFIFYAIESGKLGLIFGTPLALILGLLSNIYTKKSDKKIRYFKRCLIGALVGTIVIPISLWLYTNKYNVFIDEIILAELLIGAFSGLIGAIIYMFFEPKDELEIKSISSE